MAWAMFGDGGSDYVVRKFSELAEIAGRKLAPGQQYPVESWLNLLAARWPPLQAKDVTHQTDTRLEDVVRLSAEYCEAIALDEWSKEPLASIVIPNYRYFPTHLLEKQGPRQWAQLRFLQACERLNTPRDLWPEFKDMSITPEYAQSYGVSDPFIVPPFNALYESEAEWRDRARQLFEEVLDGQAVTVREMFQRALPGLTKIKAVKGTTPIEMRYEWAARRYCLKEQFKAMASENYNAEQIRKSATRILLEIGLKE